MIGLINKQPTPCKGCRNRDAKCHGRCAEYAEFLLAVKEDRAKRSETRNEADFFSIQGARKVKDRDAIRRRDGR